MLGIMVSILAEVRGFGKGRKSLSLHRKLP